MKILFILEYYYPNIGGVEVLFKNLAENLVNDGHSVLVITNKSSKSLSSIEIINGVKVKRLPLLNRYLFTFFSLPWILIYGRKYDFFHTTSYNAALPSFVAAKILRKKCFITFHEVWGILWFQLPNLNYLSRILYYNYEKFILKLPFDKFIAVSNYTKEALLYEGKKHEAVELIYNGIDYADYEKFHHKEPPLFTFTYFGRLRVSKGIFILLDASRGFFAENKNFKLKLIVPKKPLADLKKILRIIENYKLTPYIELYHNLSTINLRNELIRSSCIIIPSYTEGFCFAAAEVIAMNIPVISSDIGALKEVVSGKFIKMERLNASSLYKAMIKAKNNEWNVSAVKKFELFDCVRNYTALYGKS